ncbi:MAG TPA: gliding motility lipoprotein GldH [Tenuifilaceae bacterium]|nr:gliding motility lipoprotein GldH [Tenuifilaceae bacterium]HPE17573.1 gliding motility lipoprotein GldH [Tenuifilaceae bacterium]HPJ45965.1 gliding motility lipoprotein GldH [Tenuifilaceae bacterium]HPQ34309.1 gliding motility lipoprotein GldH [Tenuifilaceae bacterium]HRX67977.1 gliding motility lipoprotein GldH [Tenuifilaceae bacterium]
MRNINYLFLAISIIITSCDNYDIYNQNIMIPNEVWHMDSIAHFNVNISDTVSSHNIYINLRNTVNYPNSNLYLFIETHAPTGAKLRDTMECILANSRGEWLGKGFGRIRDNQIPYKVEIRFPSQGDYHFSIQQAMRVRELKEVVSVGLRIETTN